MGKEGELECRECVRARTGVRAFCPLHYPDGRLRKPQKTSQKTLLDGIEVTRNGANFAIRYSDGSSEPASMHEVLLWELLAALKENMAFSAMAHEGVVRNRLRRGEPNAQNIEEDEKGD